MIKVNSLHKFYGNLEVLRGINLEVSKSEIVCIVGPSGAGKSTLLHIIGTLDKPSSGEVIIDGIKITDLNERQLSRFRNEKIGFVFQFHHLLPEFTALENVLLPAMIGGANYSTSEKKAKELLDILGLSERLHHKPSSLSGGEQQRVAVARALINNPMVILADEPSGNLDSANARELHMLFFTLRDNFKQTYLIVTHNKELAEMSDRKIYLKDGKIVENHIF